MPTHTILGGKVHLYRRGDGDNWHCSAFYRGRNHRQTTKIDNLPNAEEFAEDWYLELRGKARAGLLDEKKGGKAFGPAADEFLAEYKASTKGERSERWVNEHKAHIENHLRPYFAKYRVPQIDTDLVQKYRIHRSTEEPEWLKKAKEQDAAEGKETKRKWKPPARNTVENEVITLRMILRMCERKRWLHAVPDISNPYGKQKKVVPRPWFSPDEYAALRHAARAYSLSPLRERHRWDAEQLYDEILFLSNTGLRPDEAKNLEHRDIAMVKDEGTDELILEIDVRGKTGFGPCKSRPDAVKVYQRLLNRPKWAPQGRKPRSEKTIAAATKMQPTPAETPKPTDKVFPGNHIKLFNKILTDNKLKFDRDGQRHSFYSLRHYYISQRLMEGADIYQLAKNCRTSVEIIQKFYASHIKNIIDASAINTRKPRRRKPASDRMD